MKRETKANLGRLIERIDELLAELDADIGEQPKWSGSAGYEAMADWWRKERAWLATICDTLEKQEGARFYGGSGDNHAIRLAGIRSSSTSGWRAALGNWKTAARRRIEAAEEGVN